MKHEILLGDEAVALGAVHAGLSSASSYPGTPASEIMEYLIRVSGRGAHFAASWSVNEKTAYEEALGASFAGKRAMVSFKHVGLNVAADPFMNSAITGANGGLVVVSADDPGMHSSQNEQDSRFYAQFAQIFCFEPSNHQEAYDMTREAFDISEELGFPVMVRMVTRLAHSRSSVAPREPRATERPPDRRGRKDWILLPVNARRRFDSAPRATGRDGPDVRRIPFQRPQLNEKDRSLGVIASGIGYNYLGEWLDRVDPAPSILKIGTYPLPDALVARLVDHVRTHPRHRGRRPAHRTSAQGPVRDPREDPQGEALRGPPACGRAHAGPRPGVARTRPGGRPRARPPRAGQPAAPALRRLSARGHLQGPQQGPRDVPRMPASSRTSAATPWGPCLPTTPIETCVCMGASVSMAKGGSDAGIRPAVAVIGDSTFAHSGITPLLAAAAADTDMTVIILDNSTTAMTGGQPSFGTGGGLLRLIEGLGVRKEHIRTIEPLPKNHETNVAVIREEIDHKGLSVIVAVRECLEESRKKRS